MKMRRNTLQKGSVRYIVFLEEETWYATALEFNITEAGDSPQEAMLLLFEAMTGYVQSARKMKIRDSILNQKADKEYEQMWASLQEQKKPSLPVFTSGMFNLGQLSQAFA